MRLKSGNVRKKSRSRSWTADMKHLIFERGSDISYLASALTTAAGALTWLNENSQAVGALCAIGGLLIAAATFIVTWYYKSKGGK